MIRLKETVGMDDKDKYRRARTRYLLALKPLKTPFNWHIWLTEYDQAATEAEVHKVQELTHLSAVKEDFIAAVMGAAPQWVALFEQQGLKDSSISWKETMKLLREHMARRHPIKGKQRGAFAAIESSLADSGESTQATDRDASLVDEAASSKSRGRPRNQRKDGSAKSKRSAHVESAAADGRQPCLVCEQKHDLKDCFYAFPDSAPNWFKPRPVLTALAKLRIEHDTEVQDSLRHLKRNKS